MSGEIAAVVIFQKRTPYVDQCLDNLERLTDGPWPIVLVPDREEPAYAGRGRQAPLAGGISAKRNHGVRNVPASCRYVAFIDSDAYPQTDWLVRARQRFAQSPPDVAAVTGPELTPSEDSWTRRIGGYALESPLVMGAGASAYAGTRPPSFIRNASGCNLIVSLAALSRAGGFDETLHTAEDVALSQSLLTNGYRIFYDPEVVVRHHRRDLPHFGLQWFNAGLSAKRYLRLLEAGSPLVFAPGLFVLGEAVLLATGRADLWLALQLLQVSIFGLERWRAGLRPVDALGAAAAMLLFIKSYGLGSIASFFGGGRFYLPNRRDPSPAGGAITTADIATRR